jgi:hypothetical protein
MHTAVAKHDSMMLPAVRACYGSTRIQRPVDASYHEAIRIAQVASVGWHTAWWSTTWQTLAWMSESARCWCVRLLTI